MAQSDSEKCCLVAIDNIGFSKTHADFLRWEIGSILDVTNEKVMLCFSHTHSAPNESAEPEYFNFLCAMIKCGVYDALQNIAPICAAWGNAYTDIGLNRRRNSSALDRRIGILKVCNPVNRQMELLMLRLTSHCNALKADNYMISPDYFGTVRDMLHAKYNCPILITQGAAGNVSPKYYKSAAIPPDANDDRFICSDTALDDIAQAVFRDITPVISSLQPHDIKKLSMYSRNISLFSDVPTYKEAAKIADEAKQLCGIGGTAWLAEVQRLLQSGTKEQTEETEVQYFTIDEGCLCGVPNEVMCEFAIRISSLLNNHFFYFGGYTNGCTGYLPTEEEFEKGGYEVYWSMLIYYIYHGRVFPLRRDSASKLIKFTVENSSK